MNDKARLRAALTLINIAADEAMDAVLEDRGCYPALSEDIKKGLRRRCLVRWQEEQARRKSTPSKTMAPRKRPHKTIPEKR